MLRMLGFSLCVAFALACNATDFPTAAPDGGLALAGGAASVNGAGNFDRVDTDTYRNTSVSADSKGGVHGSITVVNHFKGAGGLGTTLTKADVYCLLVVGNKAVLGGTITRDDIDPSRVGLDTVLTVIDNGEGKKATAADRISLGGVLNPGDAQFFCDNGINQTTYPIENGNLQVRP